MLAHELTAHHLAVVGEDVYQWCADHNIPSFDGVGVRDRFKVEPPKTYGDDECFWPAHLVLRAIRKTTLPELKTAPLNTEVAPADDIADPPAKFSLTPHKEIPLFDKKSGLWRKASDVSAIDHISLESLSTYRMPSNALWVAADNMSGIDRDGRMWRRPGSPKSHPRYYRPSLRKSQNP